MRFFIGVLVGSGLTYWSITGYPMLARVVALLTEGTTVLHGGIGI